MKDSEKTTEDGQSFYSEALTGSGTIQPDGTYGEPEPDPTVKRGGVTDGRTSPGGVKRPDPNEAVPPAAAPAQRAAESTTSTSKPRNSRS